MSLNSSQIEESFSTTDEDIKRLLFSILNLNLHNNSNEKLIISAINKLLSASKTRLQGLEFLNLLVSYCSNTIISENALLWISYCLVKYPEDHLKEIKLYTIGNIIESINNDQEFTKKFVSDYIPKVFENCISVHVNSHETEAALETLTVCMKYYASWFAPHKAKIENFVISFLEHSSDKLVEKASIAFLYLQQVGGAGTDGINHKANFSTNFHKLCATTQTLFDKFLENQIEIDTNNRITEDVFGFTDSSHYSQKMLRILSKRVINCLAFINTMLRKRFPVAKDIKPMDVLDIISRGTAIHHCLTMDNEKSLEDSQFAVLLTKIQIHLLHLLRTLIIWLQTNALPFSFSITKILIDCLNRSQSCQCFATDSLYQEVVYKVLRCWIRISKNSFHPHFQTHLVTCILKDITPIKNQVTLTLQSDITKSKSSKAKHKLITERIISSGQGNILKKLTAAEKVNDEKKCIFALDTLKQLQTSTTLRVKSNLLQILYSSILNTILEIETSKFNHPYTDSVCQAKLYEVLIAFYEQETLKVLPPLQLTLSILNRGVNSSNRHIASICEQGLSILEKLCQPICPSLFLPEICVSKESIHNTEEPFNNEVLDNLIDDVTSEIEQSENDGLVNSDVSEQEVETYEAVKEANIEKVTETYEEESIEQVELEAEHEENEEQADEVVDIDTETQICEESAEVTNVFGDTLEAKKSVHILDVHVLKTSDNDVEPAENVADSTEDAPVSDESYEENQAISQDSDNLAEEVNILKREIVSNSSIEISDPQLECAEPTSPTETPIDKMDNIEEEPPLKRSRFEEEIDVVGDEIKEEPKDTEDVDDTFEEDGAFVDEVKEY